MPLTASAATTRRPCFRCHGLFLRVLVFLFCFFTLFFFVLLFLFLLLLLLLLFASKPNTAADTGITNFASFQSAVRIDYD